MTDLSSEAKDLLRQARTAFSPPEGRLAMIRTALHTQIAASPVATPSSPGPASGVATRAFSAASWSTGHTIGAAILMGALGAGGIAAWVSADRPDPASRAIIEAPVVEPESAQKPLPIEESAPRDTPLEALPTPTWGASPSEVVPSSKPPALLRDRARAAVRVRPKAETPHEAPIEPLPAPADSLAEEVSMLRSARAALDRGDAAQALRLLDGHEQRFQHATLYEERVATRVLAFCALGRVDSARAAAQELERAAPRSPHLLRVRASCIAQPSTK